MNAGAPVKTNPVAAMTAGPLFVVSMWRAGSSLLYALLNKHPQVGLMFEADLALLQPLFLKPAKQQTWARRWEFWNQALSRHGIDAQRVPGGATRFHDAFTLVHQDYARRKGATIWGDKSPNYYDRLNQIAEIFPQARYIIVWRDPAATVSSMVRAGQLGSVYFARTGSASRGLLGHYVLRQQCERLLSLGKPVLQLNYDDLVNHTAVVMQEVCGFLQIPYTHDLCSLQGADRSAIFDDGSKHHALVKGDHVVSAPRPNVINPAMRRKIARYTALWQGLSQSGPGLLECTLDQLKYRVLRGYDRITAIAFCFLPLSLLSAYRAWKFRGDAPPPTGHSVAATTGLEVNNL